MKNKHFKIFAWAFLVLALVVSSHRVYADGSLVTIDLKGTSQEAVDFSNRTLKIWKISSELLSQDKVTLVKDWEKYSEEELTNRYSQPQLAGPSNSEGKISISLDKGTYYVRELDSSHKTKLYPFVLLVEGKEDITIVPKEEPSPKSGRTKLTKVSSQGTPLAGAKFELYFLGPEGKSWVPLKPDGDGSITYWEKGDKNLVLTTDQKGEIHISNLPWGDYVFKEIQAPKGYEIRNVETQFTVSGEGLTQVQIVSFKKGQGGFKFRKISQNGQPLADAQFVVTKKVGEKYKRVQVDSKDYLVKSSIGGYFLVDKLPYGDYYLWETKAPKGYAALTGPIHFTVDGKSYDHMITIKNKKIPEIPEEPDKPKPPSPPTTSNPPTPPKTPWKPKIPKTGDVTLLLLLGLGGAMAIGGYQLVKDDKKK